MDLGLKKGGYLQEVATKSTKGEFNPGFGTGQLGESAELSSEKSPRRRDVGTSRRRGRTDTREMGGKLTRCWLARSLIHDIFN